MKYFFLSLSILVTTYSYAQKTYSISYDIISNGKKLDASPLVITVQDGLVFQSKTSEKIQLVLDYNRQQQVTFFKYKDSLYKSIEPFSKLARPKFSKETDTILSYPAQKAVFSSFSNTIELWYAKANIKAAPGAFIPSKDVMVLKQVINGSRVLLATKIEEIKNAPKRSYDYQIAKTITTAKMEALKIRSRYEVLDVFKEERINFEDVVSPKKEEEIEANKTYRFSSGTVILKKINISKWKNKDVQVFARMSSRSAGDAYDRTGVVFMLPVKSNKQTLLTGLLQGADKMPSFLDKKGEKYFGMVATDSFATAVEWMRFFTPFGVGHFNDKRIIAGYDWKNKADYKQDITTLFPTDADEVYVGVFIGNYDKGGHIINLSLDIYPNENKPSNRFIQPIFNTLNIMEMSGQTYARFFRTDSLKVGFTIPEQLKNGWLLYTSTGHGGWGEGDEFVPRTNQIFIDGKPFFSVVPWRTDCASYRTLNPSSGNFSNGMSSSDYSRSNWCPGMITYPYRISLAGLSPGKHEMTIAINQGEDAGSSFSYWQVTGIMVGNF